MISLWRKLLQASCWSYLFLLSGAVLLTVAAVTDDGLNYNQPELLANKIIVIDPGHGGIDGGAVSALGDFEKEITLQISKKIADQIRATGAKVVLTRDDDTDFYTRGKGGKRNDLEKRVEISRENAAHMLISIHANAIKERKWKGAQVFYHPDSVEGKALAGCIQKYMADFPPGNRRQEKADDFYLLRNSGTPAAVIVEVGFLSNAEEAARLSDEGYQAKLAEGVFRGIVHYAAQKESTANPDQSNN